MKFLRVRFDNIGIFLDGVTIDFSVDDRVTDNAAVSEVYKSVQVPNVIGIVGVNSSGKTSVLKLIKFAMDIVLGGKSLKEIDISEGIILNGTILTVYFFHNNKFYRLESELVENKSIMDDDNLNLKFGEEKIYSKNKSTVTSRDLIFKYNQENLIYSRKKMKDKENFLLKSTDSIVLSVTQDLMVYYTDMIRETNLNFYKVKGKAQMEFINLFDNSIKSLKNDGDSLEVIFKNSNEEINCSSPLKSQEFLSSGTIKGGNLIYKIDKAIKSGGYMLVDEIEIHMHKQLVLTIIDFFNDPEINKKGATLVFTTHYAEILDAIERKDNIYITKKTDNHRCTVVRYSDVINRNDIKKSDIFLANFTGGTAPKYEEIEKVRDFLCREN